MSWMCCTTYTQRQTRDSTTPPRQTPEEISALIQAATQSFTDASRQSRKHLVLENGNRVAFRLLTWREKAATMRGHGPDNNIFEHFAQHQAKRLPLRLLQEETIEYLRICLKSF